MNKLHATIILNELCLNSLDNESMPFIDLYKNITYVFYDKITIFKNVLKLQRMGLLTITHGTFIATYTSSTITLTKKAHDYLSSNFGDFLND